MPKDPIVLDCTLRDGGYYNDWDFSPELVESYLSAMKAAKVDVVELGFRFFDPKGFNGPFAFTTDEFVDTLVLPESVKIGVMINGSDLRQDVGRQAVLERLFPRHADETRVKLVRIACHYSDLEEAFAAVDWLQGRGYQIGLNLMQIADRSDSEIDRLGSMASQSAVEVLYFADSMGSMTPDDTERVVRQIRQRWTGALGIHTHDNMGMALSNTLRAYECGVSWFDATVTGMGRGPGNARTEELMIEVEERFKRNVNLIPLVRLVRDHFGPMKAEYGWGTNLYYYLAGKRGIHPTFVQEMLNDTRYDSEDILAVLDHLRESGGGTFSVAALESGRRTENNMPYEGGWRPADCLEGRDVLIVGSGPGAMKHRAALESYICKARPVVLALNAEATIDEDLIDFRVASHPIRLMADAEEHVAQSTPLIAPQSRLSDDLRDRLSGKSLCDFEMMVEDGRFEFHETRCVVPSALVLTYVLAIMASGKPDKVMMAGFDGYPRGDDRNDEVEAILRLFGASSDVGRRIYSMTPTRYRGLPVQSVYGY